VTALAILAGACQVPPKATAPSYELLITNAQIVDGSGGAPRKGSIAIANGRIAAVGEVSGTAGKTIDARGRTVAPGFIDMHSHSDVPLLTDGNGQSKIRQGVTTEVIGESDSVAPRKTASERAPWTDFNGILRRDRKGRHLAQPAFLCWHRHRASARIGEDDKKASAKDITAMQEIVSSMMSQGAFGVSSGLIYPPNAFATVEELGEVAKAAKGGLYASHLRYDGLKLRDGIEEAIAIGERGGIPVHIFHIKVTGRKTSAA
jgi:N-acyl-D-aspartate/D-glutamate deacylase